ncbi:MAG: DGQHR domain-containing protein [candidate division Zixibacteria bacterium]|nr:DGQHR domain-containing protein [candidate division Zixibacteria bacterium]
MEIKGLISSQRITNKMIHERKSEFIKKNIKKSDLTEYVNKGWELVPNKLKTKDRIKKNKSHDKAFEERVWALLAKMKFAYLNEDNNYKIIYEINKKNNKKIGKQIDVFALDDDTALVIECKSSFRRRKIAYHKEINEYIGIKEKLRSYIRNNYGRKLKVAFLFCTNNSVLSENDKARLENEQVWHFNQDDLEYLELLADHLGSAAKYQLFGMLFFGQKIPRLENRVPAIKGKMRSGQSFYSFSIEPEFLLKTGFILHRADISPDSNSSYQRLVKKNRLIQIGKYVDKGGYFPNSIIVNIETKKKDLKFDVIKKDHDSNTIPGILYLPQVYKSIFIIDGQHRLYGYSRSKDFKNHLIPVVAFINLPAKDQSEIFVDINHNQKSVPANLLRSIMADFHWNSSDPNQAISALKTRILTEMNFDEGSPLYKKIVLSEEKKTQERCLTLQTLINNGLKRPELFGKVKGKSIIKPGHLFIENYDKTLQRSIEFFNMCLEYIHINLKDQWDKGSGEGGFISMNNGICACFLIISELLDFIATKKGVNPKQARIDMLASEIEAYLEPIVDFVIDLNFEQTKKLRGLFGAGAPEKILKEFQYAINEKFDDYNPPGLQQWVKERSGQFNEKCISVGQYIEKNLMHDFIIKKLKESYGKENWWYDSIPEKIQVKCSERRIRDSKKANDWEYLDPIDYKEILLKNWDTFVDYYTPPDMANAAKLKKLGWIVRFNDIRKKYSHPQRENTTEEEFNFLVKTKEWLSESLGWT